MFSSIAPTPDPQVDEAQRLVREQFAVIETADLTLAEANVTADYVNHRSPHEPLAARGRGPTALLATARWLHDAFSELRFDVDNIAVFADVAVAWVTMHGIHTGAFVVRDAPDGTVTDVFPATGKAFASRQVHWFRIENGAIAEHDAVRDDLDLAKQGRLGPAVSGVHRADANRPPPGSARRTRSNPPRRQAKIDEPPMRPDTKTERATADSGSRAMTRPGVTGRVVTPIIDLVADVTVVLAWAGKLVAWFAATGCTASGWAALGVPEPISWPPPPRLVLWHRAHRQLFDEIHEALSE